MKHKESMSGDWKGLRLHSYSVWHDPEVQRLTLQMRSSFPRSSRLSFGLHVIAHNSSAWVRCYLGLKEVTDKRAMQDSESSMLCRHKDKDSWGTQQYWQNHENTKAWHFHLAPRIQKTSLLLYLTSFRRWWKICCLLQYSQFIRCVMVS